MEKTLAINPFLHLNKVTPKWVIDEDADPARDFSDPRDRKAAKNWDCFGCRMRAEILVEGVAGPQSYFTTFEIETSLWGIWEPNAADRKEVEEDLIYDLRSLLETRLGVDCSKFEERFKTDHFGKPVQKPSGSIF